jgi:hypothetical protein
MRNEPSVQEVIKNVNGGFRTGYILAALALGAIVLAHVLSSSSARQIALTLRHYF